MADHITNAKGEVKLTPDEGDTLVLYASYQRLLELTEAGYDFAGGNVKIGIPDFPVVIRILGGLEDVASACDAIDQLGLTPISDAMTAAIECAPALRDRSKKEGTPDPKD